MSSIGQSLNNWLQYQGASVMRQNVSPCLPRNRKVWKNALPELEEAWGKERVWCVEDFLNEYVALAEAERATDEELDTLVNKCREMLPRALNIDILDMNKNVKHALDLISHKTYLRGEEAIGFAEGDLEYTLSLFDVVRNIIELQSQKTPDRLSKLEYIEKFVSMTHRGGGPLLSHGCDIPYGEDIDPTIIDVLSCLAGEKK